MAWTTYQGSNNRLGDAGTQPVPTPLRPAWSAQLDGSAVYGQPLVAAGLVIVATEDDNVFALNLRTGRTVWQANLGAPLRAVEEQVGCGDIDPLGVTSTPVIDPATRTIYVVAEVSSAGRAAAHHQLVALDLTTGHRLMSRAVDPPLPEDEDAVYLLQRAGLALANGRVYIGYGGQFGDCGTYHGWVVAAPVLNSGGSEAIFDVTPQSSGGAVWQGGAAPSIDQAGNVYVSTGNPNSGGPAPWAESVLKLPAGLGPTPESGFQDRSATGDMDLSAGAPVLLPDGMVFSAGKAQVGYLLHQSDLSEAATIRGSLCGSDPDGGAAYVAAADSVYLPCRGGGLQQVDLATRATGWRAGGVNSTPVVAGGRLWAAGYPSGRLEELDPGSGAVLYSTLVGRTLPNFVSPTIVGSTILVPTLSGIVALSG